MDRLQPGAARPAPRDLERRAHQVARFAGESLHHDDHGLSQAFGLVVTSAHPRLAGVQDVLVELLLHHGAPLDVTDAVYGTPPMVWALHAWLVEDRPDAPAYARILLALAAAGAKVELRKEGTTLQSATTDFFGDFKFDGLEADSGTYTLRISFAVCRGKSLEVKLGQSVNLGAIRLDARV